MYFVVITKKKTVSVPASWFDVNTITCRWPPSEKNTVQLIKNQEKPHKNWLTLPVSRFFGPFSK